MSDLNTYIKDELSYQEKLLESTIKLETFFKKYKKLVIAVATIAILSTIGYVVYEYLKEQKLINSNRAYLTLMSDFENKEAIEILKADNPKLYNLFLFQKAVRDSDEALLGDISNKNSTIISNLSLYYLANLKNSKDFIVKYQSKDALLKEFALLEEAYLSIKSKDFNNAKLKLSLISSESPIATVASSLEHFLVTKSQK